METVQGIGGFFFRADTDGNGVVAPEEGRAARAELVSQYPALATLLSEARSIAGKSPFKAVATGEKLYGMVIDYLPIREAAKGSPAPLHPGAAKYFTEKNVM